MTCLQLVCSRDVFVWMSFSTVRPKRYLVDHVGINVWIRLTSVAREDVVSLKPRLLRNLQIDVGNVSELALRRKQTYSSRSVARGPLKYCCLTFLNSLVQKILNSDPSAIIVPFFTTCRACSVRHFIFIRRQRRSKLTTAGRVLMRIMRSSYSKFLVTLTFRIICYI